MNKINGSYVIQLSKQNIIDIRPFLHACGNDILARNSVITLGKVQRVHHVILILIVIYYIL